MGPQLRGRCLPHVLTLGLVGCRPCLGIGRGNAGTQDSMAHAQSPPSLARPSHLRKPLPCGEACRPKPVALQPCHPVSMAEGTGYADRWSQRVVWEVPSCPALPHPSEDCGAPHLRLPGPYDSCATPEACWPVTRPSLRLEHTVLCGHCPQRPSLVAGAMSAPGPPPRSSLLRNGSFQRKRHLWNTVSSGCVGGTDGLL